MRPTFTLGIEEEYQTIDPETRDLRSHIATEMLAKGKLRLEERVKAEMHQSVIEVGTRVCSNIQVAQEDLFDLRRNMIALAEEHGLVLVAGATHPFADWRVQEIYPDPRYAQVVEDLQLVARANLIFGLHVHVGIEDREAQFAEHGGYRGFPAGDAAGQAESQHRQITARRRWIARCRLWICRGAGARLSRCCSSAW